jgi:hypothetical protein
VLTLGGTCRIAGARTDSWRRLSNATTKCRWHWAPPTTCALRAGCVAYITRTQYTVHSTQCTVHSTQYTVHSTQYTVHSTQYTVHSTQCTLHSTQYTVQCIVLGFGVLWLVDTPRTTHTHATSPAVLTTTYCCLTSTLSSYDVEAAKRRKRHFELLYNRTGHEVWGNV